MSDETSQGTFEILAYTGGKLRVDGFDDPVVVDLSGLEASGHIPIAIKHDTGPATILGQTDPDQITNDGKELLLGGPITADLDQSPDVKRVLAMAKKGHKWQASIGAQIEESRDVLAGESVDVNGQHLEGPFTLATKSVLRETSVLGMGADKNTRVVLSAQATLSFTAAGANEMDDENTGGFETWVKDELGLDPTTLGEKAKDALTQQYAVQMKDPAEEVDAEGDATDTDGTDEGDETPTDEGDASKKGKPPMAKASLKKPGNNGSDTDDSIARTRKAHANEQRRIASIQAKCGKDALLCATAIEKGWNVEKAELELLKRKLSDPPAGHVKSNGITLQALQGATILRAKGSLDHVGYSGELGLALGLPGWMRAGLNTEQRQRAMEAAWKFRDMTMVDLCKAACALSGNNSPHIDGSNNGFIRAAVSGGTLADIFTTNINALLIQKLLEHPDTTADWTKEADANNFQPMERTRLLKAQGLTKHERGGEADHATRADGMETYKISRYSKQFRVDEMDIIDDRFQALQDVPNEMGLGCQRLRPDLVYSIVMANANLGATGQALFSATQPGSQSNLVASAGTLAQATLMTAMAQMFNMLENGVGIDATPTHLLVPAVLFGEAASLLQSPTIVVAGTAGSVTTKGQINQLDKMQEAWGLIKIVSDQRLTNGVTDPNTGTSYAGSSTTWRLVSNKCPTIEVAYLKGSGRAPQVRQFIMDKGTWGIGWDVNMDVGAKALDWHGMFESRA